MWWQVIKSVFSLLKSVLSILLLERCGHVILIEIFLLVGRDVVIFVRACEIPEAAGGLEFLVTGPEPSGSSDGLSSRFHPRTLESW